MKRIHQVLVALLTVVLLASCSNKVGGGGTETPTTTNPVKAVTILDHMAGGDFDAHNAGIVDGTWLPTELWYYSDNAADAIITDQELMAVIWARLCVLEIDVANIDRHLAVSDGSSFYSFTWDDGSNTTFGFTINDYFNVKGGLAPIVDSSDLHRLANELYHYEPTEATSESFLESLTVAGTRFHDLTAIPSDGKNYSWDCDGDGSDDTILITSIDLGDEAPSYIEIEAYINGEPQVAHIDRAYQISEVRAYEGTDGTRGLAIVYYEGDYYSHDDLAACTLHWDGQDLIVEVID